MASNTVEIVISARDTTNRAFSAISASMKKLAIGAGILGGAITAASGALFAISKSTASAGDQFQKMAQRIGVSAQALSELKHAAELSGASIENVENGFRVLSKRMLDANEGLAEAKRSFDNLGIAVTDSNGNLRDADAVFMDSVSAINKLGSETEKTAMAQELFGRSGTMLLPMMKSGKEGIEAMRKEAQTLGITFSQLEADQAAAFQDAMLRLKKIFTGIKNTLGKELIPAFTNFAETFVEKAKEWLPIIKTFAKNFVITMMALPEIALAITNTLGEMFTRFFSDWSYFKAFWTNAFKLFMDIEVLIGNVLIEAGKIILKASSVVWVPLGEAFSVVGSILRVGWDKTVLYLQEKMLASAIWIADKLNVILPEAWEFDVSRLESSLSDVQNTIIAPAKTFKEAWAEGGQIIEELTSSIGDNIKTIGESFNETFEGVKAQFSEFAKTPEMEELFEKIDEILSASEERLQEFAEIGNAAIKKGLGADPDTIEEIKSPWELMLEYISENMLTIQDIAIQTWESFSAGFGDAIASVIVSGENLSKTFKSLMANLAKSIVSMLAKLAIEKLAYFLIDKMVKTKAAAASLAGSATETFAGAWASVISELPYPKNIIAAPIVAAASTVAMVAGAVAAGASGAAAGTSTVTAAGALHGGLEDVPAESTYLLDKGERVLSPRQNKDLDKFMDEGGSGSTTVINELNIMPHANIDEALFDKSLSWWIDLAKERILPALNELGDSRMTTTLRYSET